MPEPVEYLTREELIEIRAHSAMKKAIFTTLICFPVGLIAVYYARKLDINLKSKYLIKSFIAYKFGLLEKKQNINFASRNLKKLCKLLKNARKAKNLYILGDIRCM